MKLILTLISIFFVFQTYSQSELEVLFPKIVLKDVMNENYRGFKIRANVKPLPFNITNKYFSKYFIIKKEKSIENMETLEDMGKEMIERKFYPLSIIKNDKLNSFLLVYTDEGDSPNEFYIFSYNKKKKIISNKILVRITSSNDNFKNFKVCNDTVLVVEYIYKENDISKKDGTLFKKNKILLTPEFRLLNTDSLTFSIKTPMAFENLFKKQNEDPIILFCK